LGKNNEDDAFCSFHRGNSFWSLYVGNDLGCSEKKEIAGITADHVQWFTPAYYKDGRQRAQLFGDSSQGGAWIGRVKIPAGMRLLARDRS
jgi:hypothetical protein